MLNDHASATCKIKWLVKDCTAMAKISATILATGTICLVQHTYMYMENFVLEVLDELDQPCLC